MFYCVIIKGHRRKLNTWNTQQIFTRYPKKRESKQATITDGIEATENLERKFGKKIKLNEKVR